MARKVRIFVKDSSQHVILKSVNELTIFKDESDYKTFKDVLQECNEAHNLAIHAYVLMPHFFEFLATPAQEDSLSKFMQSLGRKYVAYFNKKYNRSGTIWEGRYKSSLVEDGRFLFDIMLYIEKIAPKEHIFSSMQKNLYNKKDDLVSLHPLYKNLGFTDEQRVEKYASFFNAPIDAKKDEFIALCLEKQNITGSKEFIKTLEKIVGMTLSKQERGRPKKQHVQKEKKMYKNLVVLDKENYIEQISEILENYDNYIDKRKKIREYCLEHYTYEIWAKTIFENMKIEID